MQENTGIKKYVLIRQAHFGYTKQSYVSGTILTVNFDEGKYTANGSTFSDLRDINIALRAGFLDAFSEKKKKQIDKETKKREEIHNKIVESKKEKPVKMEVVKSDEDLIDPIPIESKKQEVKHESEEKMEVIKENSEDTARGMTVVRSQPKELEESSQGTVVAVIGDGKSTPEEKSKVAKRTYKKRTAESEQKALKNAEKRKQDALNKRKANKSKEEK